jgi:hypothetical protein
MLARHNKPSVRQAAAMMPPGPDRDALFERADQIYAAGPGPFLEKRIAAVPRALEMIWPPRKPSSKPTPPSRRPWPANTCAMKTSLTA